MTSMSHFEFIAVFVSIIFGLAVTQVLSGAVFLLQRRELKDAHLGWTLFVLYVTTLNWWTFFPWVEQPVWSFADFSVVICWAIAHYIMATALFPSRTLEGYDFNERRHGILWAFIAAALLDAAQTGMRGALFDPWYYLVFIVYMVVATAAGLVTKIDIVHRVIPWFLLISMVTWAFVVRLFIT